MKFEPWALDIFHPVLIGWNSVVCVIALIFLPKGSLDCLPAIVRVGIGLVIIGLFADILLVYHGLDSDLFPYWAFKDLGIGIILFHYIFPKKQNEL